MELEFIIKDELGLHARPASEIAKVAMKFDSETKIFSKDKEGNLKSVMSIMSLGIKKNDTVKITIEGSDEEAATKAIEKAFVDNKIA